MRDQLFWPSTANPTTMTGDFVGYAQRSLSSSIFDMGHFRVSSIAQESAGSPAAVC